MVNENERNYCRRFKDASKEALEYEIENPTNLRLFAIYEAFKRGYTLERIAELSSISKWFLTHVQTLANTENEVTEILAKTKKKDIYEAFKTLDKGYLRKLKSLGFSDYQLVKFFLSVKDPNVKYTQKQIKTLSLQVRKLRKN
jgi:hypothetical protein